MFKKALPPDFLKFIIIIIISVVVSYLGSSTVSSLWYIGMLIWYYFSKNEAFWLAYFLITVDGFMGVMGLYSATISIFPGLPGVEVAQFYVVISVFKAAFQQTSVNLFFKNFLRVMFLYAIFLIIYGQLTGFVGETNEYFRILKLTIPLLLLYSVPRLMRRLEDYELLMAYLFPIMILAFFTQIVSLLTHFSLSNYLTLNKDKETESEIFRLFYNTGVTLLSMFGATFFMNFKERKYFSNRYLNFIIISAFGMSFVSATRGWILSFGFIMLLNFTIVNRVNIKRLSGFILVLTLVLAIGLSNEKVKLQIDYSIKRFETLEALMGGDVTAEGTLKRLDERGPRVMSQFYNSPIIGVGYSDIYIDYHDSHVGNQNILLYSGILGMTLIGGFFLFVCLVFLQRFLQTTAGSNFKRAYLSFIVFMLGWFILHSSSGQHFSFLALPIQMIPQAAFFSMAAMFFNLEKRLNAEQAVAQFQARKKFKEEQNLKKINKSIKANSNGEGV